MPTTIHDLPLESLDYLFSFVHDRDLATRTSYRDLSSLALTSKKCLLSARNILYRSPCLTSFSHLELLHRTLTTTNLGERVRDLYGLGDWIAAFNHSASIDGIFAKFLSIVGACSGLVSIEVIPGSPEQLSQLLAALSHSASTLGKLHVFNPEVREENCLSLLNFTNSLLTRPELQNVKTIMLEDEEAESPDPAILTPSLERSLRSLSISTSTRFDFDEIKRYFIFNTSSLRSLKVSMEHEIENFEPQDLRWLYEYIPSDLDRLTFSASTGCGCPLSEYLHPPSSPSLLPDFFPSLSHLRRLDIVGFRGPSLQLLQSLVSSTPKLVYLSFRESVWTSNTPIDTAALPSIFADIVFPEQEVLELVLSFEDLRFIDLGCLPTTDSQKYRRLEESLKEAGLQVQWEACS